MWSSMIQKNVVQALNNAWDDGDDDDDDVDYEEEDEDGDEYEQEDGAEEVEAYDDDQQEEEEKFDDIIEQHLQDDEPSPSAAASPATFPSPGALFMGMGRFTHFLENVTHRVENNDDYEDQEQEVDVVDAWDDDFEDSADLEGDDASSGQQPQQQTPEYEQTEQQQPPQEENDNHQQDDPDSTIGEWQDDADDLDLEDVALDATSLPVSRHQPYHQPEIPTTSTPQKQLDIAAGEDHHPDPLHEQQLPSTTTTTTPSNQPEYVDDLPPLEDVDDAWLEDDAVLDDLDTTQDKLNSTEEEQEIVFEKADEEAEEEWQKQETPVTSPQRTPILIAQHCDIMQAAVDGVMHSVVHPRNRATAPYTQDLSAEEDAQNHDIAVREIQHELHLMNDDSRHIAVQLTPRPDAYTFTPSSLSSTPLLGSRQAKADEEPSTPTTPIATPRFREPYSHIVDSTPPVSPHDALHTMGPTSSFARDSNWRGSCTTGAADASLAVLATSEDISRDTGRIDGSTIDDEDLYRDENELEYGPIVDHTPSLVEKLLRLPTTMSRENSMLVQAPRAEIATDDGWGEEDDDDVLSDKEELEGASPVNGEKQSEQNGSTATPPGVVDLSLVNEEPARTARRLPQDASVAVLASIVGSYNSREGEPDDVAEYGPVVDHTPSVVLSDTVGRGAEVDALISASTRSLGAANSMAVGFPAEDDMEDETLFGGSTIDAGTEGAAGWYDEDDDPDLDDLEDVETVTTSTTRDAPPQGGNPPVSFLLPSVPEKSVVDHTPSEFPDYRPVGFFDRDPSIAVLATEEDIAQDSGDENDEEIYDDENEIEYGPVVDHTPSTPAARSVANQPMSIACSMEVNAAGLDEEFQEDDAMDETAFGDSTLGGDTWTRDDRTIEEDEEEKPPADDKIEINGVAMVDHTPSDMGDFSLIQGRSTVDPSLDVLPSVASSSKGEVEHDSTGELGDYGLVVDQTPTTPAPSTVLRSDSVIVQAQDLDTVDETYADDVDVTYEKEQDEEERDGGDTFALDEIPAVPSEENQLVDHIPLRPESRFGDASTLVAADASELMSEVDDMAQEDNFGPVVDLTPPTRLSSVEAGVPSAAESTGAGSTAVFVPESVVADDLDADETTRGDITAGNGWYQNEEPDVEEEPNPQSGNEEPVPERLNEPQLVDFLPPQVERPAQLPAEAMSEVTVGGGGAVSLAQVLDPIEADFGPIVDQTPTMRSSIATPSGQSHASIATQLTASECRAIEKDDEAFGPPDDDDVDQGKAKVVVDNLPSQLSLKRLAVDSMISVGESQLAEEDEEDDSKFGPVVDHLPTPRASLAPSRGGSTVDALATVSEANSDVGGDGWDDDAEDMDVSESGVSDLSAFNTAVVNRMAFRKATPIENENRSVSVRFESSVCNSRPSPGRQDDDDVQNDSLMNNAYGSPDGGDSLDTDVEVVRLTSTLRDQDLQFAEADTPPSTPYRRNDTEMAAQQPFLLDVEKGAMSCMACADSRTSECPCIRRLLQANSDDALVGNLLTPEGESIQIDFKQLVEDEITKRRLIEVEVNGLRAQFRTEQANVSHYAVKEETLLSEIDALKLSNDSLEKSAALLTSSFETLTVQNSALQLELKDSEVALVEASQQAKDLIARESELMLEIVQLRKALDDSTSKISPSPDLTDTIRSLQSELQTKTREFGGLQRQLQDLEERLNSSESRGEEYSKEIEALKAQLAETSSVYEKQLETMRRQVKEVQMLERAQEELSTNFQSVQNLKSKAEQTVRDLQVQHENELQQQYRLIDRKSADIRKLEASIVALEGEKSGLIAELARQHALAAKAEALAEELLSVAKERDTLQESINESHEAIASLQQYIDEHGMERQEIESRREQEIGSLKDELRETKSLLSSKNAEAEELSGVVDKVVGEKRLLQNDLQTAQESYNTLKSEVDSAQAELHRQQTLLTSERSRLTSLEFELSRVKADLKSVTDEKNKTTSHLVALGRKLEKSENAANSNAAKVNDLETQLTRVNDELISKDLECDELAEHVSQWKSRCSELEVQLATAHDEAENRYHELYRRYEHEVAQLRNENLSLVSDLTGQKEQMVSLTSARDTLASQYAEMHNQLSLELKATTSRAQDLMKSHNEELVRLEEEKNYFAEQVAALKRQVEDLTAAEHDLSAKHKQLELRSQQLEESEVQYSSLLVQRDRTIGELQQSLDCLGSERDCLAASCRNFETVRQQLLEAQQERDALVEDNEETLVQLALLQQEKDSAERRVKDLEAELDAIETGDFSGHSQEVAELSRENNEYLDQVSRLESEKECLRTQVHTLTEEAGRLGAVINALKESGAHEADLRQLNESLQLQCGRLEEICGTKEEDIRTLTERLEQSGSECTSLSTKIELLEADRSAGNTEIETARQSLSIAHAEIHRLQDQIAGLQQAVHCRVGSSSDFELKFETATHELDELKQRLAAAESLAESNNRIYLAAADSHEMVRSNYETEMNNLMKQNESLSAALQATRSRLGEKEDEVDRLNSELTQLHSNSKISSLPSVPTGENSEHDDVESLRSQVMFFAEALARSEEARVKALSRLQTEREGGAESLRKLRDSVVKFFTMT